MSNGMLVSNTIDEAAGTSTWVWDAPDPMATYLATLQIGKYTIQRDETASGHPDHQRHPARPADRAGADAAEQHRPDPRLLRLEVRPVPVRGHRRDRRSHDRRLPDGAADAADLHERQRPRARSRTSSRTSGSATTSPCAAHARRLAQRGLRDLRNWLWVENTGGTTAQAAFNTSGRARPTRRSGTTPSTTRA